MATLLASKSFSLIGTATPLEGSCRPDPIEISVTGTAIEHRFSLAGTTTKTIWTASSDEIADFDLLWIESDQDLYVELTVDVASDVGDELATKIVLANQPFMLLGDDAIANYTANFATGTADVFDRLRVRNPGSTAANVRIVMIT